MYSSKGGGGYGGQQPYAAQQGYGQNAGTGYSGNAATGSDIGAQHALASRHSSMMGVAQEADVSGYRAHTSQAAQYGGPYASVYGSAALSSGQQAGGVSKGPVTSNFQARTAHPSSITEPTKYPSSLTESAKYSAGAPGSSFNDDYLSASTRGYAQKVDQFSGAKNSDYAMDRSYGEHQSSYIGRELQNDPPRRYTDSASLSHQHQTEMRDHLDQASLLRQQMLKAQSLHSAADMRQTEFLAARAAAIHHASQEYSSFAGKMDVDPRSLPLLGSSPYGAQHSASILGAPRRHDDLYAQESAGYGVSLPPGRDYASGKGLHGLSDSDYQGRLMSHGHFNLGVPAIPERKDDRNVYRREIDLRDEELRKDMLWEREKERERERQRERDKERERDRLLERRDRERQRDHKHALDSRRERTPPKASKDHRASSAIRDERPRRISPHRTPPRRLSPRQVSPRRVSPRREAAHRHRSPLKEKKREYVCKVKPFCLVEVERDHLSISKRYSRLSISPEFSKVILKWPNEPMHLSLYTPVSFEHDLVEYNKSEETGLVPLEEPSMCENIVWNAKVILMSGFNSNAMDELCSDKSSNERLIHFNNILRFAILKKEHSFMAIGGKWKGTVDGGDPSIDGSTLIQTAKRYVRDITQLDLQNCQHWNPFLEIHYNRIGDDGLSRYKEITLLYVPDLSKCLPTLDSWRSMWLAHRKEMTEREQRLASKKEKKASEQESVQGDNALKKSLEDCTPEKVVKSDVTNDESSGSKKNVIEQKGKLPELHGNLTEKKQGKELVGDEKTDYKKDWDLASVHPEIEVKKPVKKKIIRKVVKGKVADSKAAVVIDEAVAKDDDKVHEKEKDAGDKEAIQENLAQEHDCSADPCQVKTFVRKRIVRKVATGKVSQKEENTDIEKKPEKDTGNVEEMAIDNNELEADGAVKKSIVKTSGKKKIIRRVIKKKVTVTANKEVSGLTKDGGESVGDALGQTNIKDEEPPIVKKEQGWGESSPENKIKVESKNLAPEIDSSSEKKTNESREDKRVSRLDDKILNKNEKRGSVSSSELETTKHKDIEKSSQDAKGELSRHEKEKAIKDAKHDSRHKSHKGVKDKGKSEEPPQHPGLFIQTKRAKGSKIRSISLSLGGLLEYNDKDVEESTFELSLFAESFNEMLQYQMGCRILSFLEKLRKKIVVKYKQRKRQREEKTGKESEAEKPSTKHLKINDSPVENVTPQVKTDDSTNQNHDDTSGRELEKTGAEKSEAEKQSDDEQEDLEEMFEVDEQMEDDAPSLDVVQEMDECVVKNTNKEAESDKMSTHDHQGKESSLENSTVETGKEDEKLDKENKDDKQQPSSDKPDSVNDVVDKDLLQAFIFFDYNRVGYIKVEDLRCILHNLGKFLSHRDVKEMVQIALYESNFSRDNRIFYKKLVKITEL